MNPKERSNDVVSSIESSDHNKSVVVNDSIKKQRLSERFEPGVLDKFKIFTALMIIVPFLSYYVFDKVFGNYILGLLVGLCGTIILIGVFVYLAFEEETETPKNE